MVPKVVSDLKIGDTDKNTILTIRAGCLEKQLIKSNANSSGLLQSYARTNDKGNSLH